MKKKIAALIIALGLGAVILTGCNKQVIDVTYNYNKAIIDLQNGEVIEVNVKSWSDYDGEQIQITAEDGTTYLVSSFNCTLIKEAQS